MTTLVLGDCLDVMRTLEAGSFDVVLADPPYGMAYQSTRPSKASRRPVLANDRQPFVWWLHDAFRVLREPGALLCFCSWQTAEAFRSAIGWAGFRVRSQVVWDRVDHGMADLQTCFAPQHDLVWFATKGRMTLTAPRPRSVLSVPRLPLSRLAHPTEKPVALMAALLRSVARPGMRVLDPFAGSGVSGEACRQLGMDWTGIEVDEHHYGVARRRLDGEPAEPVRGGVVQMPLFGGKPVEFV